MPLRFSKKVVLQSIKKRGIRNPHQNAVIAREKGLGNEHNYSIFARIDSKRKKIAVLQLQPDLEITNYDNARKLTLTIQAITLTGEAKEAGLSRKGYPTYLQKFVEEEARLFGILRIRLFIAEENVKAISLAKKLGYEKKLVVGGGRRTGDTELLIFCKDLNPLTKKEIDERNAVLRARHETKKRTGKKKPAPLQLFDLREPIPAIEPVIGIDLRNAKKIREIEKTIVGKKRIVVEYLLPNGKTIFLDMQTKRISKYS
ncbi:MAG: GNAT family N-acetyltransferase [archaeon]|nr:GNAT family N-acetyltransferase [archaeon]